jgi:hypothetical protein
MKATFPMSEGRFYITVFLFRSHLFVKMVPC